MPIGRALGRGTFFDFGRVLAPGPDTRVIRTDLRFGYQQVNLSRLSSGTTFYLCGPPPGRIHPVRVSAVPREARVEVLERLSLEWTLVRRPASDHCRDGWAVASVYPVDGSATSTELTWAF